MDDATIVIKQNRCFKEVIKELSEYEEASGSKVNYGKTKGLWTGSWKGRRVSPIDVKWTSGNVFNLGVFFGNDNPARATYNKIIPQIKKRMNYWKQFKLTQIGKARIVEIFLASKLIYALKFYPIPTNDQKNIQNSIFEYLNYPQKVITISQKEMWKTKVHGGIKLVNIQVKSESMKVKWLMEMVSSPDKKLNLEIFTTLTGIQKGGITGKDLLFLQKKLYTVST